MFKRTKI